VFVRRKRRDYLCSQIDRFIESTSAQPKKLESSSSDKKFPLKKRIKEQVLVDINTSDDKLSLFDVGEQSKEKNLLSEDELTRYNPMETERKAIALEYPLLGSINVK
jgi:hypothetical protein